MGERLRFKLVFFRVLQKTEQEKLEKLTRKIAETKVARGHHGSSSLRKEALLTLRVFVAKII